MMTFLLYLIRHDVDAFAVSINVHDKILFD